MSSYPATTRAEAAPVVGGPAPIICRSARSADIPALIELGARFHAESRYKALPYDRGALRARLEDAVVRPMDHFVAVADEAGALVGVLAGLLTAFPFAPVPIAIDACFYVRPDRRGVPAARHLLAMFESWARERGAACVLLGVTSGVADERAIRLYQRLGYQLTGAILGKGV
ncbi:MAG: GNAT family N-acetyltransferase [Alphaproteobacteria bacterium]